MGSRIQACFECNLENVIALSLGGPAQLQPGTMMLKNIRTFWRKLPSGGDFYFGVSILLAYWLGRIGKPVVIGVLSTFHLAMAAITAVVWTLVTWGRINFLRIRKEWFVLLSCPWALLTWATLRATAPITGVCMIIAILAQIPLAVLKPPSNPRSKMPG
jgi:hypothetical protein